MSTAGYYLDLNQFSITKLKDLLQQIRLLPSQQILLQDIDRQFAILREHGIENLAQLQSELKTKKRLTSFAAAVGLPVDYLTVLRREVNSYQPKPINLRNFPGVDLAAIATLDLQGIKNTLQLFPYVLTPSSRAELAKNHQIAPEIILELTHLTDVARLKWVGPKFARLLVESEFDTVEKIAKSDYKELFQDLERVNAAEDIYKAAVGLEDMKSWVNVVVQSVPHAIQF